MQRREFITLLGAAAWPFSARAQQSMPVVGLLCGGNPESDGERVSAFLRGLKEGGFIDGQNVALEYRWQEQQYDRMPALAADLVHRKVALIVAMGGIPSAVATKAATMSIPILIAIGGDPVKLGLVPSLNRPGGNITGVSFLINALGAKLTQLSPARAGYLGLATTGPFKPDRCCY